MSLSKIITSELQELKRHITAGIESWHKAGQIVASAVDKDPRWIEKACAEDATLPAEVLHRFEQIGRRQIVPSLLLNDSPGYKRLRRLPYAVQERFSREPVELLLSNGDTLQVDPQNLTAAQARQVFGSDRLRSLAEQRAVLEDEKARKAVAKINGDIPWRIVGKSLVVTGPCKISVADLGNIISRIEA